jgi:hypothetical protein
MENDNRRKGHNYERYLVNIWKALGFAYAKTTRLSSRLLDSCKVDLMGVPMIIQAKSGYKRKRPKYDVTYRRIKEELAKNYPPDHPIHTFPIVLAHKVGPRGVGRKKFPENSFWTFAEEDIIQLLGDYYRLLKEKGESPPIIQ